MINSTGENCIFKRRHKHRFKTLLMLTALSIVSVAQAEIYQWVDKQGNVHITDNSMNVPDTRKENVRVIKGSEDRTPVGDSKTQPNPDLQNNDLHESDFQKHSEESAIDKRALESDLQYRWNSMKKELAAGNIEGALIYYAEGSRPSFRSQFTALKNKLPDMVAGMGEMRLVKVMEHYAECDLRTVRDGTTYSFQVLFIRERDGVWRIMSY